MAKYNKNRKQYSGINPTAVIVAIILLFAVAATLAVAIGSKWFSISDPTKWFGRNQAQEPTQGENVIAVSSDGKQIADGSEQVMPRGMTFLSKRAVNTEQTEYVGNGSISLTPQLANQYINAKYKWRVEFADGTSEWASGKDPYDYVGLEVSEDGYGPAQLNYLAPFSEQIILTVNVDGTSVEDSCTLDCLKHLKYSSNIAVENNDFNDYFTLGSNVEFTEGTVCGDFAVTSMSIVIKDDFIDNLKSYLKFDVTFKTYVIDEAIPMKLHQHENYGYYFIESNLRYFLEYSDFIVGFDELDDEHKEAIYYAWYKAAKDLGNGVQHNLLLDYDLTYTVCGTFAEKYSESDYPGGILNGESMGAEIEPSVTLNKNVIF